ncbi:hypothetical protein LJ739_16365 [Aestuariibacter halophilus]|uniref:Uncharacterized protein n=1 Tax=Fluctibacter halophilus TaxID=226011 RepID=A0ABS8GB53_9ALTE|nr:hypothetical protein [Aestuariibacter halophilus]MCC2617827.1 hypothetical protein [Aestuariibacter halophilus]
MWRRTGYYLLAVCSTFILASLLHTQFVLYELQRLSIPIDVATRLSTSADDMLGLAPGYGGVIALALLLGFLVIHGVRHYLRSDHPVWFPLAGTLAMLSALLAMQPILDITLIAGARTLPGLIAQCLAGTMGGWVYGQQFARQ